MSNIRENTACEHVVIESSGFQVCVKCAFVLDNIFSPLNSSKNHLENSCDDLQYNIFKEKFNQISELESRGLITNAVVENTKEYMKEWYKKKIPFQKYYHAYAVYVAARKNNHPISLKEISYYLQISIKNICKIEKFFNFEFNDSPFDYLSKYCNLLSLTFADEKIVSCFLTKNYTQSDKSPSHVAAGAIFATFPKINLHELSKISWIAPATIKKIATQLRARVFI